MSSIYCVAVNVYPLKETHRVLLTTSNTFKLAIQHLIDYIIPFHHFVSSFLLCVMLIVHASLGNVIVDCHSHDDRTGYNATKIYLSGWFIHMISVLLFGLVKDCDSTLGIIKHKYRDSHGNQKLLSFLFRWNCQAQTDFCHNESSWILLV